MRKKSGPQRATAERVVKDIRRKTRKQHSAEEKIRIVLEGLRGEEVTAERIRDKIAASKRKGLWMGGNVPLGYDPDGRTLQINEEEAETVKTIYQLYEDHGTMNLVLEQACVLGLRSKVRRMSDGSLRGGNLIRLMRSHLKLVRPNAVFSRS